MPPAARNEMRFAIMRYISGVHTDVGIKKKTNQDSMLLQHAQTERGEAVFAVVCDGMGGLKKGELASAEVIRACSDWFRNYFPTIIPNGVLDTDKLRASWLELMHTQDDSISRYGASSGFNLGTTLVCLLLFNGKYYIANIGDSRVYLLSDNVYQLTHDHTLIQQRIDQGLLTLDQAQTDPDRSVLLQCIGASDYVEPEFCAGDVVADTCFLLCCDGFRHMVTPSEMYEVLNAGLMTDTGRIEASLMQIAEMLKSRGETDNISAILIRTCK